MHTFDTLRATTDPFEWAELAHQMMVEGVLLETIIKESHLPRSVILDRVAMHVRVSHEINKAEAHGKVLGKAEKIQEANEAAARFRRLYSEGRIPFERTIANSVRYDGDNLLKHQRDLIDHVESRRKVIMATEEAAAGSTNPCMEVYVHPSKRGKVLCLSPKCKTWITRGAKLRYFCKRHAVASIDKYPFHDRDGDAIWITRELQVIKIKSMEESHLMNSIMFLEAAAKRRAELTGRPWEVCVNDWPRYPLLVAEVKQRDACKLCSDGVVTLGVPLDGSATEEDLLRGCRFEHCTCERGKVRQAATHVVEQAKAGGFTVTLGVALAMLTSFLIGGHAELAHGFIARVVAQLKAMGAL